MNWYLLGAGALAVVAFFIHSIIGDKEYRILRPDKNDENSRKMEVWIQVRSGWHWVSVDLLLTGVLLLLIASTNIITAKFEISFLLLIYYIATGITWLFTVVLSKKNNKQIFILGQWIFCFLVSFLIYMGLEQY